MTMGPPGRELGPSLRRLASASSAESHWQTKTEEGDLRSAGASERARLVRRRVWVAIVCREKLLWEWLLP